MAAVDYRAIGASIVSHLDGKLSSSHLVTQDISRALGKIEETVALAVLFSGFDHNEALGEMPCAPTRDARFTIGIRAVAESADAQDVLIDGAISSVEYYCNCTGHGFPIFDNTEIERAIVTGATKAQDEQYGITATVSLEIRIKEA